jgi:small subunit ribosomal protein S6
MNKYELAVVVSAKVEEDVKLATIEQVKEYITRFGGNVTDVNDCGKKKLAYEIRKMSEAFFYFIKFEADAACPGELETSLRIMENIIRYLIVREDEQ